MSRRLGLLVEGRAQVSMNLTNFRETPIARVVEMIRREAAAIWRWHSSQRTGGADPAGCADGRGGLVHAAGSNSTRQQVLESRLYDAPASLASAENCFVYRRVSRPDTDSRRRLCGRVRGRDGRRAGRNGRGADDRQKEICERGSRNAGHPCDG